jgi:Flp pilus assembly protein TadG
MRIPFRGRAFVEDRRANVAILFAVTMPMVIGGAGLGVETGYWYFRALRLQSATDTAAYAAAIEARAGSSKSAMATAASAIVAQNGYDATALNLQVIYPYVMPGGGSAVQVVVTAPEERFFSKVLSEAPVTITKAAIARFETAASACVLALDPSASKSVLVAGSSQLTLTGCNLMANSIASDAVYSQGDGTLKTPCIMSGGGAVLTAGVTLTECKSAMTNLPPVADPFKSVPKPLYSDTCNKSTGATLKPGLYCGGLSLKDEVTLDPGVYVIDGGTLKINANSIVKGSGVTFYLTNNATVDINGTAQVTLAAPTTGDYSGMLFFGDPVNHDGSNKFNGTPSSKLTGAIYFPSQAVEYLGNFSGLNGCTQVVAKTVEWTGNATVSVDCTAHGMENIPVTTTVQLAG